MTVKEIIEIMAQENERPPDNSDKLQEKLEHIRDSLGISRPEWLSVMQADNQGRVQELLIKYLFDGR